MAFEEEDVYEKSRKPTAHKTGLSRYIRRLYDDRSGTPETKNTSVSEPKLGEIAIAQLERLNHDPKAKNRLTNWATKHLNNRKG